MGQKLIFAVDFDGCLVEFDFPKIGEQTSKQKKLMSILKKLQEKGHKLILWTSRGEPALQEAIDWCEDKGLIFDMHQVNPFTKKLTGPSPKIIADYYIDVKALEFGDDESRDRTLFLLERLLDE